MLRVGSTSFRLGATLAGGMVLLSLGGLGKLAASPQDGFEGSAHQCASRKHCLNISNSGSGAAIVATAAANAGVVGTTLNQSTQDNFGASGLQGIDAGSDGGQQNIGVQGISTTSNGVEGITNSPSLTEPFGRAAVFGIDASNDGGQRNWGSAGFSTNGTGVLGISLAPPQTAGGPFASSLLAVCENGGSSIEAADSPFSTGNLFLLADCAGNLTLEGTLTTGSAPLVATKNAKGIAVGAYTSRAAQPMIEDFGQAQLNAGNARVTLSGDFAATIVRDTNYLVSLTPEGDSRGLYVTRKTTAGFEVRESQGGRSSLTFTYRIVAKPLGDRSARLPLVAQVLARSSQRTLQRAPNPLETIRRIGGSGALPAARLR